MVKNATLAVEQGKLLDALKELWRGLLEKRIVDALLVPQELPWGDNVVQTLVASAENLVAANPLAPVLPVNSARIVSQMTKVAPSPRRLGVVLRPCESRALVELVKLKQASLHNLVLIGIDCFGTYPLERYRQLCRESSSPTEDFLKAIGEGREDSSLRQACQICEYPSPMNADLAIGLIGVDHDKGILLQASTAEGERILGELGLKDGPQAEVAKREQAISHLVAQRTKKRDELLEQTQREVSGLENLLRLLAPCINCHNCRDVCPLCYCKECFFDSPTFEVEAERYLGWAERRGALRMPTDTLLFHLTRMNHMAVCCVGCGMCQEACPNDIPVAKIFRLVGLRVQSIFNYVPGRSLEEELPLATFKEEELQEVGER